MAKTIAQLTALGATPDDGDSLIIDDSGITKKVTAAQLKGDCVRAAKNNVLSTTTGTQIGTASNELLAFWGATPVDEPAVTADLLDSLQEVGIIASGAGNTPLNLSDGAFECGTVTCGTITLDDAANIVANTTTGTKIGTSTSQKIGFWNATPIVQPASANQAALTNATGGTANGTLELVAATNTGDRSASINNNFTELHVLLNEIRNVLVNTGLMKGAA